MLPGTIIKIWWTAFLRLTDEVNDPYGLEDP